MLLQEPTIIPRRGGAEHFRCESCGTVVHGETSPERCPSCGGVKFYKADMETPIVDAGPV